VSRPVWLIDALALACVLAIVWPSGAARRRLRTPAAEPRFAMPTLDLPVMRARLESLAVRRPRRLVALFALVASIVGGIPGGPVAALVSTVYGALAARALARRIANQRDTAARAHHLDDLCSLAADLRAGLPPATAADLHPAQRPRVHHAGRGLSVEASGTAAPQTVTHAPPSPATTAVSKHAIHSELRITELTAAVWRLAEHTGAPAADLVERIEADARAADRAKASAAAQAAGAQATALLLAALPLGGIALGYAIGADPLRVLLHTPLGAACAAGAVLLQCAGLFWADRLTNGPIR
jgi:tight adherence protein B